MAFKDVLKAVSPIANVIDKNPDFLRGMGLVGGAVANKLEDREERKRREAEMAAQAGVQPQGVPPVTMKKGGKVSSASKRADGCAIKGKTKGRMV